MVYAGLAPWLIGRLAALTDPQADLRGPYLLLAPLYAILAVHLWLIVEARRWSRERESRAHLLSAEYQPIVDRYCAELGIPTITVFESTFEENGEFVVRRDSALWVDTKAARTYSMGEREFLLARQTAARKGSKAVSAVERAGTIAILLAAQFIATLNLWLIIPLHIGGALGVLVCSRARFRRETLNTDRLALSLTNDLGSAESAIGKLSETAVWPLGREERIQQLRSVGRLAS